MKHIRLSILPSLVPHLRHTCVVLFFFLAPAVQAYSAAPSDTLTLFFAGDAMGHSPQFQWAYKAETGTYDYEPNFRYLAPYVRKADASIVNLEVTLGGEPYSGYPNFSSPDAYFDALKNAGFGIYLLANNHILDRGSRGMERTLDVLGGMPNVGVYRDSADRAARYPLICEINGWRVAFFNCTYGCNGYYPLPPQMVNFIDTAEIRRDIESVRDKNVDLRVMCIHWGVEYELGAVQRQRDLAHWFAEAGFDLVIGGHPHVVENAEVINGVPVYYSLGNLVSNQRREHTNGGIVVRARFVRTADGRFAVETAYEPCYVHKGGITYMQDGKSITERHFFILPTTDYISGALPFRLNKEEEAALMRFHNNTVQRLANMPLF